MIISLTTVQVTGNVQLKRRNALPGPSQSYKHLSPGVTEESKM